MNAPFIHFRFILLLAVVSAITLSCKKKDDSQPTPALRTPVDYNLLTETTPYKKYFVDAKGDSTVDRTEGRTLLRMLTALDAYCKSSVANGTAMDSTTLSNMFHNKSNAFVAPYTDLNGINYSIQKYTATSTTFKTNTDKDFEKMFGVIARTSLAVENTASYGVAGVYTNGDDKYLVDTAGVEYSETMVNAFIGALQLDYISNVLLFTGINANNLALVPGKNYTPLEHNWDVAYGLLTTNDIYGLGATDNVLNPGEVFLGANLWKYKKEYYKHLYLAFLRGRAAIVNNDLVELRKQSIVIRSILELGVGSFAAGSMERAVQLPTTAEKIHAFGQGFGAIYAIRFCTIYGGNVDFSNGLKNILFTPTITRFEDIDADTQLYVVYNNINNKFGLYK